MKFTPTKIPEVIIVIPKRHFDNRGYFSETYQRADFAKIGIEMEFVQDNHSKSIPKNVLRGLHYQAPPHAQAKLVRVVCGAIFDVAVDIRRSSPTFGQWVGHVLSAENKKQMWVPEGFAHGFLVVSDVAEILYKTTNYYAPEYERSIVWNDKNLKINWPSTGEPVLSGKDANAPFLSRSELVEDS